MLRTPQIANRTRNQRWAKSFQNAIKGFNPKLDYLQVDLLNRNKDYRGRFKDIANSNMAINYDCQIHAIYGLKGTDQKQEVIIDYTTHSEQSLALTLLDCDAIATCYVEDRDDLELLHSKVIVRFIDPDVYAERVRKKEIVTDDFNLKFRYHKGEHFDITNNA